MMTELPPDNHPKDTPESQVSKESGAIPETASNAAASAGAVGGTTPWAKPAIGTSVFRNPDSWTFPSAIGGQIDIPLAGGGATGGDITAEGLPGAISGINVGEHTEEMQKLGRVGSMPIPKTNTDYLQHTTATHLMPMEIENEETLPLSTQKREVSSGMIPEWGIIPGWQTGFWKVNKTNVQTQKGDKGYARGQDTQATEAG